MAPEPVIEKLTHSTINNAIDDIPLSYPPLIVEMLSKCYKAGYEVRCDRLPSGYYQISLGEKLLPEFHQALVLFYVAGTQIKVHRDSPTYAAGAAQINIIGRARFSISGCQDVRRMESYWLNEGDCIAFDNKQPHGIERVESERWCICFFKLKAEYLTQEKTKQLSLI
ncbi:hypothetical protein [Nostoc sp. JL34]|nr:hypothetical protein [Nostoc sp. JL34]